jgi:hypothetical protein
MYPRSAVKYEKVVSACANLNCISLDVASSIITNNVHFGARPSNQSCGDPSIWINSPTLDRLSRIG